MHSLHWALVETRSKICLTHVVRPLILNFTTISENLLVCVKDLPDTQVIRPLILNFTSFSGNLLTHVKKKLLYTSVCKIKTNYSTQAALTADRRRLKH